MPIRLKDATVNVHGLHDRVIEDILLPAERIFLDEGYETVVTSACDGVHGHRSFHYLLGAIDLRTKHVHTRETKQRIVNRLIKRTPDDVDVLLEHLGNANEHLHAEIDDRRLLERHVKNLQARFLDRLPTGAVMP